MFGRRCASTLARVPNASSCPRHISSGVMAPYRTFTSSRHTMNSKPNKNREAVLPVSAEEAGDEPWRSSAGVDAYLYERLAHPKLAGDPSLARSQARADEAGMPPIAVPAMLGQLLTILAKSMNATRVLEIGTLAGYSTSFLANALPTHGQIDTIEYSEAHAKVAQKNFLDMDLYPFPTMHVGKALDLLRDPRGKFAKPPGADLGLPTEEQGYDLVFVDANKDQYFEYFQEVLRLTRPGGVMVFDNAIRGGRIAVPDSAKADSDTVGLRKMYDWIRDDAGKTVICSTLQTVGEKHWDGFAVVYKQ